MRTKPQDQMTIFYGWIFKTFYEKKRIMHLLQKILAITDSLTPLFVNLLHGFSNFVQDFISSHGWAQKTYYVVKQMLNLVSGDWNKAMMDYVFENPKFSMFIVFIVNFVVSGIYTFAFNLFIKLIIRSVYFFKNSFKFLMVKASSIILVVGTSILPEHFAQFDTTINKKIEDSSPKTKDLLNDNPESLFPVHNSEASILKINNSESIVKNGPISEYMHNFVWYVPYQGDYFQIFLHGFAAQPVVESVMGSPVRDLEVVANVASAVASALGT